MKKAFLLLICLLALLPAHKAGAQYVGNYSDLLLKSSPGKIKLVQRGYGAVLGVQRGKYTFLEIGGEHYWRKIKLIKPHTFTLGTSFQYNIGHNILGYRLYSYYRRGRINLTYGGGINYLTDFNVSRIGISPELGFRLLGFHLTTGVNLLAGNRDLKTYNLFFVGLNYYFPVDRKIKLKKKQ